MNPLIKKIVPPLLILLSGCASVSVTSPNLLELNYDDVSEVFPVEGKVDAFNNRLKTTLLSSLSGSARKTCNSYYCFELAVFDGDKILLSRAVSLEEGEVATIHNNSDAKTGLDVVKGSGVDFSSTCIQPYHAKTGLIASACLLDNHNVMRFSYTVDLKAIFDSAGVSGYVEQCENDGFCGVSGSLGRAIKSRFEVVNIPKIKKSRANAFLKPYRNYYFIVVGVTSSLESKK